MVSNQRQEQVGAKPKIVIAYCTCTKCCLLFSFAMFAGDHMSKIFYFIKNNLREYW